MESVDNFTLGVIYKECHVLNLEAPIFRTELIFFSTHNHFKNILRRVGTVIYRIRANLHLPLRYECMAPAKHLH